MHGDACRPGCDPGTGMPALWSLRQVPVWSEKSACCLDRLISNLSLLTMRPPNVIKRPRSAAFTNTALLLPKKLWRRKNGNASW